MLFFICYGEFVVQKLINTVFVGLSGGVDSSVSAALLKQAGYTVVGVFIRTWQPDFIECSFRQDRLDAMRVAAQLDIPFLECDAEAEYKKAVADYMIEEYRLGRTPNPDILCNREIKFGVFWRFAKARGADFIATGHYAQTDGTVLKKGIDPAKDQAYFLWTLTSDDLAHTLFPIGHLHKSAVRKLAKKFGQSTSQKKDSQGVCMLGDLDIKAFLSHYITPVRGDVINEAGECIGYHDGAVFLTVGERHGFTITKKTTDSGRQYIISKDIEKNTIVVSDAPVEKRAQTRSVVLTKCNWASGINQHKNYMAQVRYHGELFGCTIIGEPTTSETTIEFQSPVIVALGQSVVLYDGDMCVGGGIVA